MQHRLCALICARDEIASRRLGRLLVERGVHCEWTRTAQDAIRKLALETFDVLVIDLILPDQDGISFIQGLRDSGCNIPVVGLSLRSSVAPSSTNLHAAVKQAQTDAAAERARAIFALKVATQRMKGYRPQVLSLSPDEFTNRLVTRTLERYTQLTSARSIEAARELIQNTPFDFVLADPEILADDKALQEFASYCPTLPLILHTVYHIRNHNGSPLQATKELANIIRTYAMHGHQRTVVAQA